MKEQNILFSESKAKDTIDGPVECFGQNFVSDKARRDYFIGKLQEKLKDPAFRKIEGFPVGTDADILALSDPPYYTACPNPFIADFIKHYGKPYDPNVSYSREPFAADLLGSKATKIYMAHTYHTKVPPESIVPLIAHYTQPGDLILDPFCGSGMTGVAVHMFNQSIVREKRRAAIVCDLSPFASFLSHQMTHADKVDRFRHSYEKILATLKSEIGWIYKRKDGREINYILWSDIWLCPNCGTAASDWDMTVDEKLIEVRPPCCAKCKLNLKRSELTRKKVKVIDPVLNIMRNQSLQEIARIVLRDNKRTVIIPPEKSDFTVIDDIIPLIAHLNIPIIELPAGMNTQQPISSHNYSYVHDFFSIRSLVFICKYIEIARRSDAYHDLLFLLTSVLVKTASKLHAIGFGGTINLAGQAPNTLQIPSTGAERNLFNLIENKAKDIEAVLTYSKEPSRVLVSTGAAQNMQFLPNSSIDYIFTDPPFGANINYSEVSFLYEAWLKVFTSTSKEAIINKCQYKDVMRYESLMTESLCECYRVLKPGRWITVEFHNSANSIWTAIQNALGRAGFVIADVRIFDKGQGTWKQMTASGAVKQDLIISAYKPDGSLEGRFELEAGTDVGVWDFVRSHLKQLPVFVAKDSRAEVIVERQSYLLFDRMVAFHVQRGAMVPLSAAEFYAGLTQRYSEREGMYFLPEQVAEYDKKRMTVKELMQLQLFVSDEASAIQWLKQQIVQKPQTFQELHPQFIKEIGGWQKHETLIELSEVLAQNFLHYDGIGDVPSQIHSYLSTNFKELRNLLKDDPGLRAKAKDRWYVPDPNKASDLEKLREKFLLKEFDEYRVSSQRKLKVFRVEAVRAGFKKAWQERDYNTIIHVSQKIPDNVLQDDPKLLMWYDQALTRTGDKS